MMHFNELETRYELRMAELQQERAKLREAGQLREAGLSGGIPVRQRLASALIVLAVRLSPSALPLPDPGPLSSGTR